MKIDISKYYTASERKTILSADEDPSLTQHIQTETIHMIRLWLCTLNFKFTRGNDCSVTTYVVSDCITCTCNK